MTTVKYKISEGSIPSLSGADETEVWLYAPAVKTFIKLTQDQGDFHYVEELIECSKPK